MTSVVFPEIQSVPLIVVPKRHISKVFIHCSASDTKSHDNVATIRKWHLERGFNDIGYHYVITSDGKIHQGRSLNLIPAAQKGHNAGSIAICVTGLNTFTTEQMQTLILFCSEIERAFYKLPISSEITFHGHCEVEPLKACPVFNYKEVLRLDSESRIIHSQKYWNNLYR